jgi:hypothetical protein
VTEFTSPGDLKNILFYNEKESKPSLPAQDPEMHSQFLNRFRSVPNKEKYNILGDFQARE